MIRAALAMLLCSLMACAAESSGQADITLQGYYLGGNSQLPERITGLAFGFRDFFPGLGLIQGNFEGYANGQFQTGDNFLELQGAAWLGRRWSFRGGDFQTSAILVDFPFHNVFTPELTARGLRISTEHGPVTYEFFWGHETVQEGPRVPFRITVPQTEMGAAMRYKLGRLQAGLRYLRLSSRLDAIQNNPFLFPSGRDYGTVNIVAAQALYRLTRSLHLYGEASRSSASDPAAPQTGATVPLSLFAGSAWETPNLTARVTYARQGVLYLPLAGYYAGDRQGPFAELQYRPWKWIELSGSASHYRNNLEQNPQVATFRSTSTSTGATVQLPANWNGAVQLSTIQFTAQPAGAAPAGNSSDRHLAVSLARPFHRHTVRFSAHDLKLISNSQPANQRWGEVEDTFHIKRLMLGADVRMQQVIGSERRNTVYARASAMFNTSRFTFYGNVEFGQDLLNQTVFATNTYRTTVAGISTRLPGRWTLQAEAFRNSLNMALNPESIFLLETGGVGLSNSLASLNQWSVFIRLKRQIQWGRPLPSGDLDRYVAAQLPLVGTVDGFVFEQRISGQSPAAGIPVSLEDGRTATTDAEGRYHFSDVPEGAHRVLLSSSELPADYDPGTTGEAVVSVRSRRITRADLSVVRLTALAGTVTGPEKTPLENILVRLLPTARYTTTDSAGRFVFHNLREGDYEVALDEHTLPEDSVLTSPARVPAAVRLDTTPPEIRFEFTKQEKRKPVRKVNLNGS